MISSQVDILPTIAGIVGISYTNTTMGRDLLHVKDTTSDIAFIIDHDVRNIAIVRGEYLFQHQLMNNEESLVSINNNDLIAKEKSKNISDTMRNLTMGIFEISKYMLFHNAKAHK